MTAAAMPVPPGKLQAWKMAVRLPTLTAAVAPVAVGTGVAVHDGEFAALPAAAALAGALCLQVGANFANDVFDFKRGADTADRLGPPRATQMGLLSPREMLAGMWAMFAIAFVIGIYLVWIGGWPIVIAGLASILAAIIYTGGPWPIGYHALGDVFTFVFFGLVAVAGTYYVQADAVSGLAWLAAIPMGCTVTMILVVNNLRDRETDARTRKTTLAVIMGDGVTRAWFVTLLAGAYVVALVVTTTGEARWGVAAGLASLPWAVPLVRAVSVERITGRALNPVLRATARFNLVYGLMWAFVLALS